MSRSGEVSANTKLTVPQYHRAGTVAQPTKRLLPPRLVSTLYGRADLFGRALEELGRHQPVVLHGMAGMGKSALASMIAWTLIEEYPNGVLWVSGGATPIDSICDDVGQQLEDEHMFSLDAAAKPSRVRYLLGTHDVLVVLDDCWDPDVARGFAQQCLPAGHGLLVTSREKIARLGTLLEIGSLDLGAGVELFRDTSEIRAATAEPEIVQLVRLLGGHPQALVIAGQMCCEEEISTKELLALLGSAGDRVRRLKLGNAATNNVWATFDLSYQRLKTEEQIVFRTLGGAWSKSVTPRLMANIVLADEATVDSALRGLVKRALARGEDLPGGLKRYVVHDLLHAFAQGLAGESGLSTQDVWDEWLKAVSQYVDAYCGESIEFHDALDAELGNLLGAATTAADLDRNADVLDLADALCSHSNFLFRRGYNLQAVGLLGRAVKAARMMADRHREGEHLGNLGYAHALLSNYPLAVDHYGQALEIAQVLNDREGQAKWIGLTGLAYDNIGEYTQAIRCYEQAIAHERVLGNRAGEGRWLGSLAGIHRSRGDGIRAIELYEQAISVARELGDLGNECVHLSNLASVYRYHGDYARALAYYEEALPISVTLHDKATQGRILINTGLCLTRHGRPADALDYCIKGLEIFSTIGFKSGEGYARGYMGETFWGLGDSTAAREETLQALAMHRELGVKSGQADWLHNLGMWAIHEGESTQGVAFLREALEIRTRLGVVSADETRRILRECGETTDHVR